MARIRHPTFDEQEMRSTSDFFKEIDGETDRAAVVLGAARLDLLLYQLLTWFFLPSPTSNDELLDGDAPLGTFHSRIQMAYRLGLIEADLARALHLIRKIRNGFAHELSAAKLDKGAHADRVRELVAPLKTAKRFFRFAEQTFPESTGLRREFLAALGIVGYRLNGAAHYAIPIGKRRPMPGVGSIGLLPPNWTPRPKKKTKKT